MELTVRPDSGSLIDLEKVKKTWKRVAGWEPDSLKITEIGNGTAYIKVLGKPSGMGGLVPVGMKGRRRREDTVGKEPREDEGGSHGVPSNEIPNGNRSFFDTEWAEGDDDWDVDRESTGEVDEALGQPLAEDHLENPENPSHSQEWKIDQKQPEPERLDTVYDRLLLSGNQSHVDQSVDRDKGTPMKANMKPIEDTATSDSHQIPLASPQPVNQARDMPREIRVIMTGLIDFTFRVSPGCSVKKLLKKGSEKFKLDGPLFASVAFSDLDESATLGDVWQRFGDNDAGVNLEISMRPKLSTSSGNQTEIHLRSVRRTSTSRRRKSGVPSESPPKRRRTLSGRQTDQDEHFDLPSQQDAMNFFDGEDEDFVDDQEALDLAIALSLSTLSS